MKNFLLKGALVAIGLVATTAAASAQVCVLAIFGAAIYVSATEKRELTEKEAMTCGLSRLFDGKKDDKKEDKSGDKKHSKKDAVKVKKTAAARRHKTDHQTQ